MGKAKAKLRSKAKQPLSVDAEIDQKAARIRSMGYRMFEDFSVDMPASTLGATMMHNRGLLDWELDLLATRCVQGTGKALVPVKPCEEDGSIEFYSAREDFWKPSCQALERLCFPIPKGGLRCMLKAISPDGACILNTIHDFQAPRVSDLLTPRHKLAETRSIFALDLLHTGGLRNGCAAMTPKEACQFAETAKPDFAHINSETFENVCAARRVRDYFVKCVETGRVRAALDRGDVVVTPHFSRFNLATHSGDFCKECLHELEYDKDMPVTAMLAVIAFLQRVGEFWGPFYDTDADILPTPVNGPPGMSSFLVESGATTGTEEDLVKYEQNARRTLMAAVATPGRLKWNVGPAASVFANVSVWSGPDHVCTNARLVLCPLNGPPCSSGAFFTRDLEAFSEELPPKCRGLLRQDQYSAYREFWSHEADWVYERPRLRIAFEFNKGSFDFGNAKEWAPKVYKPRHPGGGCHSTPPPPAPPKPAPVAPEESEWFKLLCKGVAREMCDGIVDSVLRRLQAPPRRSAAERRAEVAEVHVRAPGAAHQPRVVRVARAAPEGSVEDSKKKAAREAHLAKLAEQAKAKTEARKRADDARYEQMRNELVGAAIGGW